MKTAALILIVLLITVSGCKKKDDPSNTELLTQNTWVHNHVMIDENKNLIPDDEIGQQKDKSFDFNADGTLVYTVNQEILPLQWVFENNETSVRIIGVMDSLTIPLITESVYNIYELDENTLTYYNRSSVNNPETGTFDIYKHEQNQ